MFEAVTLGESVGVGGGDCVGGSSDNVRGIGVFAAVTPVDRAKGYYDVTFPHAGGLGMSLEEKFGPGAGGGGGGGASYVTKVAEGGAADKGNVRGGGRRLRRAGQSRYQSRAYGHHFEAQEWAGRTANEAWVRRCGIGTWCWFLCVCGVE